MRADAGADLQLIARSRRFQLGRPRDIALAAGGVLFLRTRSGTDPVCCLWRLDPDTSEEILLVDPAGLVDDPAGGVCADERSRRERLHEAAEGIVAYSCDAAGEHVTFALAGRLFVLRCVTREVLELPVPGPVVDPQFDAAGRHIAFVTPDGLQVVDRAGTLVVALHNPGPAQRYGVAEFVAAEELNRHRGHWWSPDGTALLVTLVDERPVATWWRAEPDRPETAPVAQRYPAAGAANADVTLLRLDLDGATTTVSWARDRLPYLVGVSWQSGYPPLLTLMNRAQTRLDTVAVSSDGSTRLVHSDTDERWVYPVPGTPAWLSDGRLLHARSADDTISLFAGDERITPPGLQVGAVAQAGARVLFTAATEPTEQHVYAWHRGEAAPRQLSTGSGVHSCAGDDRGLVLVSETLDGPASAVVQAPGRRDAALRSLEVASRTPAPVELLALGATRLRTAVLFPRPEVRPPGKLPVLMDPYGGPLSQRVRAMRRLFHEPQWFADQGFAVIVADGRGSPNRGPAWEREMYRDLASPALEDQITVLDEVARHWPGELDLERVAMRGWSFGGYLSALAVLRRPDLFAAAIAGAPVSDWRRYDSVVAERYLGAPSDQPEAYARTSLLELAGPLRRPLLLVHGLADDNVHPAHSFELAHRLTSAGTPPRLVTLPRATHMLRQPGDIATLLRIELEFLRDALHVAAHPATGH
ncbi:prolyl oligopeptidase family serine peptidase [Dactylosporangium sp. CA-233914]|uniref:S9 family peptidase n=1 Tax=Dactylosporangium sp. CA-233914 TaxID=3239934 RepID=UPI003D8A610C